jgi:hypothetical protein
MVLSLLYNHTMWQSDSLSPTCITNVLLIISFEIMGEQSIDLRLRLNGGFFLSEGGAPENNLD